MKNNIVIAGYNTVYREYLSERDKLKSGPYIRKLLKMMKPGSSVLDLGCGAGYPVDDMLIKAGHSVTGIDISPAMIQMASKLCPAGQYLVGDMADLAPRSYQVDAAISIYALFHLPRESHHIWLQTVRSFLPLGGLLLVTMGDRDFEGTTNFYGQNMWWSQWGTVKNEQLVRGAGFEILLSEVAHSGAEHHHFVLAKAV